jgi:hypothetical protein
VSGFVAAVGLPGGLWSGSPDEQPTALVRAGDEFWVMSPAEYAIWGSALDAPSLAELYARVSQVATTQDVDDLVASGALALFSGRLATDRRALEGLRLHLLGLGVANSVESPGSFRFVDAGCQPRLDVNQVLYTLLLTANTARSLWEMCYRQARVVEADPAETAGALLNALPAVLASGAARLDVAT